jgi:hypothetical protein
LNAIDASSAPFLTSRSPHASQSGAPQTPSSQVRGIAVPKISGDKIGAASVETPSTQVPLHPNASQIPSSQEKRQTTAKPGRKQHKTGRRNPFRPPAEVTDPSDMRRTMISI